MTCDQFLRRYSEFRDGWLGPAVHRKFEDHIRQCSSCRRYDRVLSRGVQVLRSLPTPDSSPDFAPRLKHRIFHLEDGSPLGSTAGGSAALVAVATVGILALAWLPFALTTPVELELPAISVERPAAEREAATATSANTATSASLFSSGPFVSPVLDEAGRGFRRVGRWSDPSTGSRAAGAAGWGWLVTPEGAPSGTPAEDAAESGTRSSLR